MIERYIAAAATVALLLGLGSRRLRDLPLSEPMVALLAGVVLGPEVLGVLAMPDERGPEILLPAAEIVLGLAVMSAALRFRPDAIREQLGPLAVLLVAVLPVMAVACALVGFWSLSIALASAVVLGTAVAPTDPVLAASVVAGEPAERDVPEKLRVQLSMESAANDGLTFAFVFLAIAGVTHESLGAATATIARELAIALVIGVLAGTGVGKLLRLADRHHEIEHSSMLVLTVLLTLAVLGTVDALGGQGVVAVFAAGLAYNAQVSSTERRSEWEIEEAMNRYLVLPVFVILGAALPWSEWGDLGWRTVPLVVGILFLRRLPAVLALRGLLRLSVAEALFLGWVGPIGVAAIYYLSEALHRDALARPMWAAGILVVVVSTVVHGVTSTMSRRALAGR